MGMYIKKIDYRDKENLIRIINESFNYVESHKDYYSKQRYGSECAKGVLFLGAYTEGTNELIGCVGLQSKGAGLSKVIRLAVLEEYRHLGTGKKLMYEVELRAKSQGVKTLSLGLVTSNDRLFRWYEGHGYKLAKTIIKNVGRTQISMMKKTISHIYKINKAYGYDYLSKNHRLNTLDYDKLSKVQFCLIYSRSEIGKKNNTGVLCQRLLDDRVSEYIWRRNAEEELISYIDSIRLRGYSPVLVYKDDDIRESVHKATDCLETVNGQGICYIIIDATWQEAKNIYKRSDILRSLTWFHISGDIVSEFALRRNQVEGGLCTAEVVGELLKYHITSEQVESYMATIKPYIRG